MMLQTRFIKIKLIDFISVAMLLTFVICLIIKNTSHLSYTTFFQVLLNIEGTLFLAGSISPGNNFSGEGETLIEKLNWLLIKPLSGVTPIIFNPLRFCWGLLFLILSTITGVI